LGNKEAHEKYFESFLKFNTAIVELENGAVNSFFTHLTEEQENDYVYIDKLYQRFAYIGMVSIVLVILSGFILFRLNRARIRRLREITGY
jgi:hypothetical protein